VEDATRLDKRIRVVLAVSIRAPVEDATCFIPIIWPNRLRFDPRARGGRDSRPTQPSYTTSVSIRAPVEDATLDAIITKQGELVSIRAPVEDATGEFPVYVFEYPVSIRAPVEDATPTPARNTVESACFDPRARGGRD
tara:strand:- start:617 stop:1030 length:414 start_codon:yes stop_codon:yes gene_type:complete